MNKQNKNINFNNLCKNKNITNNNKNIHKLDYFEFLFVVLIDY